MKEPNVERLIVEMVNLFSYILYEAIVEDVKERYSMGLILEQQKTFKTYNFKRYATHVTIQK